jgi:hypothetical protein
VSSSSTVIYNDPIWNPLELLSRFLDEGGSGQRFGVFVISLAFAVRTSPDPKYPVFLYLLKFPHEPFVQSG